MTEVERYHSYDAFADAYDSHWRRTDIRLEQRRYSPSEVRAALVSADFTDIELVDAQDVGFGDTGRAFFVARKPY